MPTPTKIRVQVSLTPSQLAGLKALEAKTAAPIAAQIRRGVDLWLAQHGVAPPKKGGK